MGPLITGQTPRAPEFGYDVLEYESGSGIRCTIIHRCFFSPFDEVLCHGDYIPDMRMSCQWIDRPYEINYPFLKYL